MTDLIRDVRHALRSLARSPAFLAVALASMAVGIGANTSIFSLLDQVLLRRLPVERPQDLVLIASEGEHYGNNRGGQALSFPMYEDFRDMLVARQGGDLRPRVSDPIIGRELARPVFTDICARFPLGVGISIDGQSERATAELVSGTFFSMLNVSPAAGRLIDPGDDRAPLSSAVAVLGYDYWQRRFGGSPSVIGKAIRINDTPFTIAGVSARGFFGVDIGYAPDVRLPMMMKQPLTPGWYDLNNRRSRWPNIFARLAPGVSQDDASAAVQGVFQRIIDAEVTQPVFANAAPDTRKAFLHMTSKLLPAAQGRAPLRQQLSQPLWILMAAAAGVLLIACANVAGLLVARTAARRRDIAVRVALGAARWQVVRPILVESLIVGLAGGTLGVVLSLWTTRFLLGFLLPPNSPAVVSATPDPRILAFAFVVSVASALVFGLLPAVTGTRGARANLLRQRTLAGGASFRKALVVAQVALSLLLLVGAGLFIGSLRQLRNIDLGVRTDNVVTFRASPVASGYSAARSAAFYRDVLTRLRARPGVSGAGLAAMGILEGNEWDSSMTIEGVSQATHGNANPYMNAVSPGYFAALGIPLLAGRDFREADMWQASDPPPAGGTGDGYLVAIANEHFARHYFPKASAIGRHIGFGSDPGTPTPIEIVGVVGDAKYTGVRDEVPDQLFVPIFQGRAATAGLVYVRATERPDAMFTAIRDVVRQVDPNIPVFSTRTLDDKADQSLVNDRLIATLSAAFGVIATLLAVVGLYGLMSYMVTQRTREVGIRVALGALSGQVLWLVAREAAKLVGIGLVIGFVAAIGTGRLVESVLYGIPAHDPATIAIAVVLLGAAGIAAGLGPALRASRLDPVRALRDE
jgi:predicted permease